MNADPRCGAAHTLRQPHGPSEQRATSATTGQRARAREREVLRGFLRAYPRSEENAVFTLRIGRGQTIAVTRTRLSQLIDTRLHPRWRQVVHLGIEERWSRADVCAHLKDISIKTYERDQIHALETLLAIIRGEARAMEQRRE